MLRLLGSCHSPINRPLLRARSRIIQRSCLFSPSSAGESHKRLLATRSNAARIWPSRSSTKTQLLQMLLALGTLCGAAGITLLPLSSALAQDGGAPAGGCISFKEDPAVVCLSNDALLGPVVSALLTKIRDRQSNCTNFAFYCDRLMNLLVEVALGALESQFVTVITPTGAQVQGSELAQPVAAVSILRSGESIIKAFSRACPGAPTGKLLLVKHEADPSMANVLYSKMPKKLADHQVLLFDPMLATGSTMVLALRVLTSEYGVDSRKIVVVSMISCPDAIKNLHTAFPGVKIVTAAVDPGLDENSFVSPGLGSFGDRYFASQ